MTIRVIVKNDDCRESAVLSVQQQTTDGESVSGSSDVDLKAGEAKEFDVHSNQKLMVKEVRQ